MAKAAGDTRDVNIVANERLQKLNSNLSESARNLAERQRTERNPEGITRGGGINYSAPQSNDYHELTRGGNAQTQARPDSYGTRHDSETDSPHVGGRIGGKRGVDNVTSQNRGE